MVPSHQPLSFILLYDDPVFDYPPNRNSPQWRQRQHTGRCSSSSLRRGGLAVYQGKWPSTFSPLKLSPASAKGHRMSCFKPPHVRPFFFPLMIHGCFVVWVTEYSNKRAAVQRSPFHPSLSGISTCTPFQQVDRFPILFLRFVSYKGASPSLAKWHLFNNGCYKVFVDHKTTIISS